MAPDAQAGRSLEGPRSGTIGVYLHVPFCERVCPYCDFAVVAARPLSTDVEERTVRALLRELETRAEALRELSLASIYFGGGTPALLQPESIARLVDAVHERFPRHTDSEHEVEVTLETNPSTVERDRLPAFRDAGVNRLSLGIQSFDDQVLKRLGRAHRGVEGRATLEAARAAGFDDLSVDLIYAVPGAPARAALDDLALLAAFEPEHLSVYELTLEPETPFGRAHARGRLDPLPDEEIVALGEAIEEQAEKQGLSRYEVSSYARPGCESRHNRRYWRREPVLGLGMSAWSNGPPEPGAPHGTRESNERNLDVWAERVLEGGRAIAVRERLSPATARGEAVFLGLRELRTGVDRAAFAREFGADLEHFFAGELAGLRREGLVEDRPDGHLRLTRRGRWFADSVAQAFVEASGRPEDGEQR